MRGEARRGVAWRGTLSPRRYGPWPSRWGVSRTGSPPKSVIHMILAWKGNGMHFIFQTPCVVLRAVLRGAWSRERRPPAFCEAAELCGPTSVGR